MDEAYSVYREILIWDNKNRRAQIIKKQRHTLRTALSFLTVLTLLTVAVAFMGMTITPQARTESARIKYYTTHTVSPSDSLYDISEQYISGEYEGIEEHIHEICHINHIDETEGLQVGSQLVIPYYSSEFRQ